VDYLKRAKEMEASDLHMIIGSSPFVRLKEQILYFDQPPLTQEMIEHFMGEIMSGTMYADFLKNRDIDFSYELPSVARFRVNVCAHHNGYAMTFRIIPFKVPDITKLSLPPLVKRFSKYQDGIVLFTGPGRCGKSSTMASLVETINMERRNHIIILEDPIEFVYEEKLSTITQRQVHLHTESYSTAVRAALRESPDVLVIGELRDLDTISTALSAAETGHLVFATLHTHNAIQTIDRLIDSFPSREQQQIRTALSETLRGVVSQFLIPSADGSRLLPVMEILFVTAAISNLIRENKTYQIVSSIQLGKKYEMKLLDDSLEEYAKDGLITEFQAMAYAQNPDRFIGVS
jgi:twitching motility protein PilT